MFFSARTLLVGGVAFLCPALAQAHVSIASGPGFANTTQEVTFGVGHGCEGSDTYSVRIEIPAGVTSVRPESNSFGKATVEKDDTGAIIAVIWQKADIDALDSDVEYYKLVMRLKLADQPFTTLYFPAFQICRAADGTMTSVDWIAMTEGGDAEPAPKLSVVPARRGGWNKYSVPSEIADLSAYFNDALIVWKGSKAYSPNPTTLDLIKSTDGVSELTALGSGDEIWVKY
jgi:uncharacterized protein YcnI